MAISLPAGICSCGGEGNGFLAKDINRSADLYIIDCFCRHILSNSFVVGVHRGNFPLGETAAVNRSSSSPYEPHSRQSPLHLRKC
jgi:hypothetical protein